MHKWCIYTGQQCRAEVPDTQGTCSTLGGHAQPRAEVPDTGPLIGHSSARGPDSNHGKENQRQFNWNVRDTSRSITEGNRSRAIYVVGTLFRVTQGRPHGLRGESSPAVERVTGASTGHSALGVRKLGARSQNRSTVTHGPCLTVSAALGERRTRSPLLLMSRCLAQVVEGTARGQLLPAFGMETRRAYIAHLRPAMSNADQEKHGL